MALRMGQLYDALVLAHVPEDKARLASEEIALLDDRMGRIERDITILKWMVGITIALQLIMISGMVGLAVRMVR